MALSGKGPVATCNAACGHNNFNDITLRHQTTATSYYKNSFAVSEQFWGHLIILWLWNTMPIKWSLTNTNEQPGRQITFKQHHINAKLTSRRCTNVNMTSPRYCLPLG